ncbi:MAG: aminotransferase class V-fold PLP-dependent enzyme [Chthonomonas sp.]|nr:aminotransferase class V-fold PLP-dependent enzyme [Chthonomonas sp.]
MKEHFSLALESTPGRFHFAAHSHHLWPDCTLGAQVQAWQDAASLADVKWEKVFGEVIPAVQQGIARHLNLPDPKTIVFAPNTHEFVLRLLSCLPADRPARILTTDSEFYSFRRQTQRLAEDGLVELTIIPAEPHGTFAERFVAAGTDFDLVFFSQVFFNSGFAVRNLAQIVQAFAEPTMVVIDGYHGYFAVPTDLSQVASRAFYMAGGYKYAMSGEGACFLHCPPGQALRPRNTGWFAEMDSLAAAKTGQVDYASDGFRMAGATFDPSGLYRMRAVLDWVQASGGSVSTYHSHAKRLQARFLAGLAHPALGEAQLVVPSIELSRGNFLTFQTPHASELYYFLRGHGVITDTRGDRLRFGFGIYQDESDVDHLLALLR